MAGSFITVIFFMAKDGLAATSPIMGGIVVSALIFFIITALDRKKHVVDIHEDGTVYVDGVLQENKTRKSAEAMGLE